LLDHDAPPIGHHLAEAAIEAFGFLVLASVEPDGLGVFPHPHKGETEIGLEALLEEVEANERSADQMREHRAHAGIHHGRPEHGSGNGDVKQVDIAGEAPQDDGEGDEAHHRFKQPEGQGQGLLDEPVDILADTLVRVVGETLLEAQAVVGLVGQPAVHIFGGQPAPPADLQHLAQVDLIDGDDNIDDGQDGEPAKEPEKSLKVFILEGIVKEVVPLVEQDVYVDDAEAHADDDGQQQAGFEAFLGFPVRFGESPQVAKEVSLGGGHGKTPGCGRDGAPG